MADTTTTRADQPRGGKLANLQLTNFLLITFAC